MKTQRELLEDEQENFEEKLQGLRAYIKELTARAEKHGTGEEHLDDDLIKAENDARYYEGQLDQIRRELGKSKDRDDWPPAPTGTRSLIQASLAFAAGVCLGVLLRRRG